MCGATVLSTCTVLACIGIGAGGGYDDSKMTERKETISQKISLRA
jgi:hypothetical protein